MINSNHSYKNTRVEDIIIEKTSMNNIIMENTVIKNTSTKNTSMENTSTGNEIAAEYKNAETNKYGAVNENHAGLEERILGGRFKLVKILGSGGMSTVYLAENINLGTFWAIKQIPKDNKNGLDILVEPTILKKLNHPSLPRIIDIIEDDKYLYIVQDYIEGIPLDKELEKVGKFPLHTVLEWSLQICDVLIYLHEFKPNPIIYRDMKPGNIILTPWNEIKLVDFGIAREYKKGRKNDTVYIGTKGYAAPEQYGEGQTSIVTDIYCFGVTMFQLITGKLPQELFLSIKLPGHFADDIPPRIEEIISKCTRFNPEERYCNVRELKNDILNARNQLLLNNKGSKSWDSFDNEPMEAVEVDGIHDTGINNIVNNANKTVDKIDDKDFSNVKNNDFDNVYTDSINDINDNSCDNNYGNKYNKNRKDKRSNIFNIRDSNTVASGYGNDNGSSKRYGAKDKIIKLKNLFIGNLSNNIRRSKPILSYKSMIITVWDNAEFACELAYVLAKSTSLNVLLADMDLLCPTADLILNIKKYPERIIREGILNESGLNIVLDSAAKGVLTRESFISACIKRKEVSNLYILTGNYRLENYEYYSNESLTIFIDKSRQLFDVVILAVNRSIYDAFTVISLIKSDVNIIPICAVVHKLREFNNYIVFLKDKQKIPLEKNKFVAFEYNAKTHLSEAAISEATQYNYLGSVRFCPQREKCRNQRIAYSQKMDKKVKEDYIRILRKIKIFP